MCVSIVFVIFYNKNGQKNILFHFFFIFTLVASIITKIISFLTKTKTIMVNFIKMFTYRENRINQRKNAKQWDCVFLKLDSLSFQKMQILKYSIEGFFVLEQF